MKLSILIFTCLLMAACSDERSLNPAAPTPPTAPAVKLVWPVQHPDGGYGHEDPQYPPPACACPGGYGVHYNGWNFVCRRQMEAHYYDVEMPHACQ